MWTLDVRMFAAYVWWFVTKEADEKERAKFRSRLWVPPPTRRAEPIPENSPWNPEAENKALAALQAQIGGGR
jgi:hypothetical protein